VGGQLEVFTRSFELLDADEYTYTYMENNKHIFIMADADAILSSLRVQVGGNTKQHSCTMPARVSPTCATNNGCLTMRISSPPGDSAG
jgi:hypothetical protein